MIEHILSLCAFGFVLLVVSHVWLVVRVLHPLHRLALDAEELTNGNFTALKQPVGGIPEIGRVRYAMDCMVGHVLRAQEHSQFYAQSLANGQETERARIARELHDDTVQSIIGVLQGVDMATQWLHSAPGQAESMLTMAREQSVDIINGLRNLIADLRPPALEELGVIAALEMQGERLSDAIDFHIHVDGQPRRLSETHELTLFRVAQEAMVNANRHSQAEQVTVTVGYHPDRVCLTIADNGVGFNTDRTLQTLSAAGHYGLIGIQERVQSLEGEVTFESAPNEGTVVSAWIPESTNHQPQHAVRDPVCHAVIEPDQAYGKRVYQGQAYFFCCPVCQGAFQKNPESYLSTSELTNTTTPDAR
jgi:signal transduction histidine kinase/YHS domain-containing protein